MTQGKLKRSFTGKKVRKVGEDKIGVVVKSKYLQQASRNQKRNNNNNWFHINFDDLVAVNWNKGEGKSDISWCNKKILQLVD